MHPSFGVSKMVFVKPKVSQKPLTKPIDPISNKNLAKTTLNITSILYLYAIRDQLECGRKTLINCNTR